MIATTIRLEPTFGFMLVALSYGVRAEGLPGLTALRS